MPLSSRVRSTGATASTSDCKGRPRLSSSTSDLGFGEVFSSAPVDAATSDTAWLRALVNVEIALVGAAARVGLVPVVAAERIIAACDEPRLDVNAILDGWDRDATPVPALVDELRRVIRSKATARYLHVGATSQDIVDTAMSLIARRAIIAAIPDAIRASHLLAELARKHRDTPQVGRTLLQQAEVTTFGAACASRLTAVDYALGDVGLVQTDRLAVQLGGAAGSLTGVGDHGPDLVKEFAGVLDLSVPLTPWHTTRSRFAELATVLGIACGELAGVAQDVVLLSATEIGEVRVAAPGRSSAMAHKRNPAPAVLALACAHRVPGLVSTMLAGMPQGLQRSAGQWQAEWPTLTSLLRLFGGVARHTMESLDGLTVDTDRMRAHVDALLDGDEPDLGSAPAFVDSALAAHDAIWARMRDA